MRTLEVLGLGVDDLEHRLRVLLVAHRVEVAHVALVRGAQKVLEAWSRDHVEGLSAHEYLRAPWLRARLHALRVHERLVQIEHEVQLAAVQLGLGVGGDEVGEGGVDNGVEGG